MAELSHRPFGWGHPYEQDIDERVPRKPVVGETIKLLAGCKPGNAFRRVWWQWKMMMDPAWQETEADLQSSCSEGGSQWAAEIPALAERSRLVYQLWGETQEGEVHSGGAFEVDISAWFSPDLIAEVSETDGLLMVRYAFLAVEIVIDLIYRVDDDGNLNIMPTLADGPVEGLQAAGRWVPFDGSKVWENEMYQVRIASESQLISVLKNGEVLFEEQEPFEVLVTAENKICAFRRKLKPIKDEVFLGLGERFNALNQAGECLDTRVFEQYRQQGSKTYIPIPFFLSSRGCGWFQNANRRAKFHFPETPDSPLLITQETGEELGEQTVIFSDPDWEEIVRKFTRFVALPALPPVWAFGLWMSSNEWYTQEEVERQVALMKEHRIPATVLVIEAWSDEENFYIWNDAKYTPKDSAERFTLEEFTFPEYGKWSDPKGMTDRLHEEGLRLILWQIPVLKHLFPRDLVKFGINEQHDRDEAYMIQQGYCVHNADGSPYRVPPIWFAKSLVWDVTNPAAVDWWLSKRQYLLDEIGIDGFKTDGGEHLWGEDLRFADGRTNAEMWNHFPKMYQKHYYDFANQHQDDGAVLFSRAGYTGSQTEPCHWAGDQDSTWESFKAVLLAGQNLGISGLPFWGWDIGGFSGPIPTAELYLRSAAAATFAPVMQYHSEHNEHRPVSVDRTPWNIQEQTGDERVLPIFRKYAGLRMNLLPYLYSEAVHTGRTGGPLFGCPYVRFKDRKCLSTPYQFLCGRYLLVAPITEPGAESWPVYLPEGLWVDFWEGIEYEGGREIMVDAPLDKIPVFVQSGAVLPFNLNSDDEFGMTMDNNLCRYDTLAIVKFGSDDVNFIYIWSDYVTRQDYVLDAGMDLMKDLEPVSGYSREIIKLIKSS